MKIKNKIEKPFGSSGSVTGILMFFSGGIMLYFSLIGLVLVIPGAFIGFTYTASWVDLERKRIKSVTNYFGVFLYGKWFDLKPEMKLAIKKSQKGYRTSTRGHSRDFHVLDYRIILYGINNKQILPIFKSKTIELAKAEINKLSKQ